VAGKQAIDEAPPAACRAGMKKRTHLCVLLVVEKIFRAAARKNRKLQQAAIALIKMPQSVNFKDKGLRAIQTAGKCTH